MADNTSLEISFTDSIEECDYGIIFEPDPNPAREGDKVKIYLYGASKEELDKTRLYYGSSDLGMGSPVKTEIEEDYEESIYFNDTNIVKTKYPFSTINSSIASTEIVIKNGNKIESYLPKGETVDLTKESDACINIKEIVTGSIKINYNASKKYKTYNWDVPNIDTDTEFPFYVVREGHEPQEESLIAKISDSYENVDVKLIIKNIANDQIIKDAQVTVTKQGTDPEVLNDVSDENGECVFSLTPNATYDLRVTAVGFIDSNNDYLNNDSFRVPTPDMVE